MIRLAFLAAFLALPALAHDGTHDAWMESLQQPNGSSCCNRMDCAPTDAWRLSGEHYSVFLAGEWREVPPERVITNRGNPVGRAVLCAMGAHIFCFVPGAMI